MTNRTLGRLAAGFALIAGIATTVVFAQNTDPHQQGIGPNHRGMMDWDAMDAPE